MKKKISPMWEGSFMGWMMKHELLVTLVATILATLVTIAAIGLVAPGLLLWL